MPLNSWTAQLSSALAVLNRCDRDDCVCHHEGLSPWSNDRNQIRNANMTV